MDRPLPFRERLTGLATAALRALKDGRWSAESAASLSNDEFFALLGIPELTNAQAAHALGLPGPLIEKRHGCHVWRPESFPPEDPRHGWTWDDCWNDAVALLGSEEAVLAYLGSGETLPSRADSLSTQADMVAPTIDTTSDEAFRLVSEEASPKKQRRLGFGEPTFTSPSRPEPPRYLDCPDPRTARYLAVVVRIIDAHRRFPGRMLLGRKKVEKLVHVIERHLGLDLGREPIRAAAGPLDLPRHKLVCRIAEERGIFQTIEPERHPSEDAGGESSRDAVRFEPLDHFDQAVAESAEVLGRRVVEADHLISHLMKLTPLQAETVATLYAAWQDLFASGVSPRDEDIFRAFWAWHPEKTKFSKTEVFFELVWMRQEGITPR